jgi:hypothetical protein
MTPDELPADMEAVVSEWLGMAQSVEPTAVSAIRGVAICQTEIDDIRALLKAYQEQRRALEAASPVVPVGVSVDALAQEIRRVDGRHTLGAGALAEALLPFLAALRPTDTGWRAIATAPKDGRVVLVFSAARCVWSVVSAQWRQDWPNGGWDTISKHTTPIVPTHWMPLPPAPTDTGREA